MDDEKREIMAALKQAADGLRDVSRQAGRGARGAGVRAYRRAPVGACAAGDGLQGGPGPDRREDVRALEEEYVREPVAGPGGREDRRRAAGSRRGIWHEGTGRSAVQEARASLGQMNTLVSALMDAMDKASSCSSPGGMAEAFDSLENMCSMQMGINQGTQQMMSLGEQGPQYGGARADGAAGRRAGGGQAAGWTIWRGSTVTATRSWGGWTTWPKKPGRSSRTSRVSGSARRPCSVRRRSSRGCWMPRSRCAGGNTRSGGSRGRARCIRWPRRRPSPWRSARPRSAICCTGGAATTRRSMRN